MSNIQKYSDKTFEEIRHHNKQVRNFGLQGH